MIQINSNDAMKSQSLSVDINDVCDENIDFETDAITYSIIITQSSICLLSDGLSIQSQLNENNKRKLCMVTIGKDTAVNHTMRFTMSAITDSESVSMTSYPMGTLYPMGT